MVGLLETIDGWIAETPPIDQPQRFGNKAFRTIYSRLKEVCSVIHLYVWCLFATCKKSLI